jgi:hypothetical protein
MRGVIWIVVLALLGATLAEAQHRRVVERIKIGRDIRVFHAEKLALHGSIINIVGPEDTEGHDDDNIAELAGREDHPFIIKRSYGLRNGLAGIGVRDGKRYIIWDQVGARTSDLRRLSWGMKLDITRVVIP